MDRSSKYFGLNINPENPNAGFLLLPGKARQKLLTKIKLAAEINCPVLIEGESGTGKELIAKAIHYHSQRHHRPFLPVNCAALNNDLTASQLFGHIRGAFTGAVSQQIGLIKAAEGGTLFLDEISSLSLEAQAQILRFLESGEIRAVGSTSLSFPEVRVIAASNISLQKLCGEKKFREDLFFRLNIYNINNIPLRTESENIPHFASFFLEQQTQRYSLPVKHFSPEVLDFFRCYHWPGNIREMQAVILKGLLNSGKSKNICLTHLEMNFQPPGQLNICLENDWESVLGEVEYHYLIYQLQKCYGRQQELIKAAKKSKNYIRQRLEKFKINPKVFAKNSLLQKH